MSFSIELMTDLSEYLEAETQLTWGTIQLGASSDIFAASLEYWDVSDYYRHWLRAIKRIIENNNSSALVTCMYNPLTSNFLVWWPIYRISNLIYVQQHILFFDQIGSKFNDAEIFSYVPPREKVTPQGQPIAEWRLEIDDLQDYLEQF